MNRYLTACLLAVLVSPPLVASEEVVLDSNLEKFSYAMGFRMARELLQQGITKADPAAFAEGVSDALDGASFRFSREELQAVMSAYQQELVAERASAAAENKEEGDAFLAANALEDGVTRLESGVQYKVVTAGQGATPGADDTVRVHYAGRLLDGTEFDSSYKRGSPTELALSDVIPGWQEALKEMASGSKWLVWIPPEQAYGLRGAGALIGPNETLEFDIELIEVLPKE